MILLFLILGFSRWAAAAPLSTGADFLLMTTGARPDGMGQAFSAVADDINTLSFNPAGLGNIRLPEVGYGYESFLAGIDYNFFGAAVPMGGAGVLGLGYIGMGTAPFNSTANPLATPGTALNQALIAGWGRSFYDFHAGFSVKYIMEQLDGTHGNGFGFDMGLRYRPLPTFTLAASLMNLGPGIRLASPEPLPTLVNLGLAWTAVEQGDSNLNLALSGSFDISTNTQSLGVGAEYWYREAFALRAGYLANSRDADFTENGLCAGAGVRVSFLQLDYAFQPFDALGVINRVSAILRWDGPWASGGEPNPPKYVHVLSLSQAMEIRWERPQGPARGYEVMIQPLDGGDLILSPVIPNNLYYFKNYQPGTIYKIAVRTVNGNSRSFPSEEVYAMGPEAVPEEALSGGSRLSVANWVKGEVDAVGLRLSWVAQPGSEGYDLYRQSPSGQITMVTLAPRKSNQVWVTDTSGLAGWKWYVTSVSGGKASEKTVGFFLWYPTNKETDLLSQSPQTRLHAEAQEGHRMFLDWDRYDGANGYTLFYGTEPDGVMEFYRDYPAGANTALLDISNRKKKTLFLIAPKDFGGEWTRKSNEVTAEFLAPDTNE